MIVNGNNAVSRADIFCVSYGFLDRNGANARSVGWQREVSPTIRESVIPTVLFVCKKAGKGALIQWEKSATLGVSQEQTLFVWKGTEQDLPIVVTDGAWGG